MTLFYVIAALLTVAVVIALVRPLLRPAPASDASAQGLNAAVYRDQLQVLERDLAEGTIQQSEYEAARDELHLRLLQDEKAGAATAPARRTGLWTPKRSALAVGVTLPLVSALLYAWLGAPLAIDAQRAVEAQQHDMIRTVESLARRLEASPDNPKGWAMLARSYKVLGRMEEAERAYARVGPMLETDPDSLAHYADLLASRTNSFEGKPKELLRKALAIDPKHPMSLMLAGTIAYQEGRFAAAAADWEKLLGVLDPGSPDAQQLQADIADARARAGLPAQAPAQRMAAAAPLPADPAPGAMAQVQPSAAPPGPPEEMVARLADRLKSNPDDVAGWERLARSYEVLGKPAEAAQARVEMAKAAERAKR